MPLINCPECGKQISDKSDICIGCGFPIKSQLAEMERSIAKCPYCNSTDIDNEGYCNECGMNTIKNNPKNVEIIKSKELKSTEIEFNGIYKYDFWGNKSEVYCPRCGSENCSHHLEQKLIPGKTKTRYTANLNPLKPFTLVNKKEKVVRKDYEYTEKKILCNSCGCVFK